MFLANPKHILSAIDWALQGQSSQSLHALGSVIFLDQRQGLQSVNNRT